MDFIPNKQLEKRPKIFGVPLNELMLLGLFFMVCMIIGGSLMNFGLSGKPAFIAGTLGLFGGGIALRIANKKERPTFLLSLLSYFNQPKKIHVREPVIILKKRAEKEVNPTRSEGN